MLRRELIQGHPRMKEKYQTLTLFSEQCLLFFCDAWILGLQSVLLALHNSLKPAILEGWSLTFNKSIKNYIFILSPYICPYIAVYSCTQTNGTMNVFCTATTKSLHSTPGIIIILDKFGKWFPLKPHWKRQSLMLSNNKCEVKKSAILWRTIHIHKNFLNLQKMNEILH